MVSVDVTQHWTWMWILVLCEGKERIHCRHFNHYFFSRISSTRSVPWEQRFCHAVLWTSSIQKLYGKEQMNGHVFLVGFFKWWSSELTQSYRKWQWLYKTTENGSDYTRLQKMAVTIQDYIELTWSYRKWQWLYKTTENGSDYTRLHRINTELQKMAVTVQDYTEVTRSYRKWQWLYKTTQK